MISSYITCLEIMQALEKIAPKELAEDWDNPGLLVGKPSQPVSKILISLDVTLEVVNKAISDRANIIVAHHPIIFRAVKKFRTDKPLGRLLELLIKNNIAVIAVHTNLDTVCGGVNDILANKLGLQYIHPLIPLEQDINKGFGLGRVGVLSEPMEIRELAKQVKNALPTAGIRIVEVENRTVKKVALCGGAGAEFIGQAASLGADVFITGDVKYHEAQQARGLGIHLIDAGHFGTEFPIVSILADRLEHELHTMYPHMNVAIIPDNFSKDIFYFI